MLKFILPSLLLFACSDVFAQQPAPSEPALADPRTYLAEIGKICQTDWPNNRAVNIVCHGHSVPAGYFKTPEVHTLEAYPHLLRVGLAERYPHAVLNVIVTAIGGENAEAGAARFEASVLSHHPDVVTIDYALNDRRIGLERARKAWVQMIQLAQAKGVKVILLTPTGDLSAAMDDPQDPLNQHAAQIRALAREYHTGLADSNAAFQQYVKQGGKLSGLMSQINHPNREGHVLVVKELMEWFPSAPNPAAK